MRRVCIPVLLILSVFLTNLQSQTNIYEGDVSGLWKENLSPYLIHGDISVPENAALVIQPGVELVFQGYYKFVVEGKLLAIGNETDTIVFTTADTVEFWNGLKFLNIIGADKDTCRLTYCKLEFSKTTGSYMSDGGGIFIKNSKKIVIKNCLIQHNTSRYNGGGIASYNGLYYLENTTIRENDAGNGGGLCFEEGGGGFISNCLITKNSGKGGGIYFNDSFAVIDSCIISYNTGNSGTGGMQGDFHSPFFCSNSIVERNVGAHTGGVSAGGDIKLENVTIRYNFGVNTGGISFGTNSEPELSEENRCNIYWNYSSKVQDISMVKQQYIKLDTFTVKHADDYVADVPNNNHIHPLNYIIDDQTTEDLYVDPEGSNENSGLTPDDPLKNIDYALRKIKPNLYKPSVIHLADGVYSNSTNSEFFPVIAKSGTNIRGNSNDETILDANFKTAAVQIVEKESCGLERLRLVNGVFPDGGGISIFKSEEIEIDSCTINGNSASDEGGGMYIGSSDDVIVTYCNFVNNYSDTYGGGLEISNSNNIMTVNCIFENNYADYGGGIYTCWDNDIIGCLFTNNHAHSGGGFASNWANLSIINSTFYGNRASYNGSAINPNSSNVHLINSIIWDDTLQPSPIYLSHYVHSGEFDFSISYTDLMGGDSSIVVMDEDLHIYWEEGNMDYYPEFVDIENKDFSLEDHSPCVNQGTPDPSGLYLPELDLAANERIVKGRVDMGAYENQLGVSTAGISVREPIAIYPNPNNGDFSIEIKTTEEALIRIYDLSGRIVKSMEKQEQTFGIFQIGGLQPGTYLIKVTTKNAESRGRVIVASCYSSSANL